MFEQQYALIAIVVVWVASLCAVYMIAQYQAKRFIVKKLLDEINRRRRAKYADRVD